MNSAEADAEELHRFLAEFLREYLLRETEEGQGASENEIWHRQGADRGLHRMR